MRKKILILLLSAISFNSFSQNQQLPKTAISAGYGLVTVPQIIQGVSDILTSVVTYYEDAKFSGALILGAKFKAGNRFMVGVDGLYEKFSKEVYSVANDNYLGNSKGQYFTIIPRADFYWLNSNFIRLYSGIGIGASFAQQEFNNDKNTKTILAFNFAPIGTEIGNKFCVFGETSFGYNGLLSLGLRLRF